jgi:hypothetical protein
VSVGRGAAALDPPARELSVRASVTEGVNVLRAMARRLAAAIAVSPRVVEAANRNVNQVLESLERGREA